VTLRQTLATLLVASLVPGLALAQLAPAGTGEGAVPAPFIPETTLAINSPTPLAQRVVAYNIDAKYNAVKHTLDGTELLTYHNVTGQTLDRFPFHLYLNAFQPKATWVREAKAMGSRDTSYEEWEEKDWGSDEIKSFEVVGIGDLTSKLEFIQPDDGNKDDKTVVQVVLPKAVAPGDYVQFKIRFHDEFPETQARSGWNRDFVLGGQWFPKVGVWWHGAWNCHQYHATTEFFADFGVYDVSLTLPQYEVAGASGVLMKEVKNSDGTQTFTYHGDDIHDFAWTAGPRYRVAEDTYQGTMGTVQLRLMMQPAHWRQEQRHAKILKESLEHFERWYGPYPYKTLTLVDPEPGSAAFGMEYPTFITGGTFWWMPSSIYEPELVVEHEFGHQYWYGMVATNEFEDAWMDEGINSYTEVKVMDSIFGRDTSIRNLFGATYGEREDQRLFYIGVADLDPMARNAWQYANSHSYGGVTYGKTASFLLTLEKIVGEETLRNALHTYFMRYRFTHPTKEDFLKTIEEVSGKDLRWYFNQAVYGTQVFDYEVMQISSDPVNWYEKDVKEKRGETVYESRVLLHRKGDFIFPVDIEIRFDNGERLREQWDGRDRWVKFGYQKKAKIVSAEIDPDHGIYLDRDNFNNSRTLAPNKAPARKLANYWSFVVQFFSQFLAWWLV
jgi:Peptidase family M1 domain